MLRRGEEQAERPRGTRGDLVGLFNATKMTTQDSNVDRKVEGSDYIRRQGERPRFTCRSLRNDPWSGAMGPTSLGRRRIRREVCNNPESRQLNGRSGGGGVWCWS